MCRQAGGSKYVILQKTYASIPVRIDDETLAERIYGPILYQRLEWLAYEVMGVATFKRFLRRSQVSIRAAMIHYRNGR